MVCNKGSEMSRLSRNESDQNRKHDGPAVGLYVGNQIPKYESQQKVKNWK